MRVETLESREVPSATLLNGVLFVDVDDTSGVKTVSVDRVGQVVQVSENGKISSFDSAMVNSLVVQGTDRAENVIQNNTNITSVLLGGKKDDVIFGGSGKNTIDAGKGQDVVYALLGMNTINSVDKQFDRVFTNAGAMVTADAADTVVRFFAAGRTPGTPFIGQEADGVLYITPSNNGSAVTIDDGPVKGSVVVNYDLGDGLGVQTKIFFDVKAISYFGGSGDDYFMNNTKIDNAAYGSAGNDTLFGGYGYSLLKGSGGNDVLVGRGKMNDISGNGGADVIVDLNKKPGDILRVDAMDTVIDLGKATRISP